MTPHAPRRPSTARPRRGDLALIVTESPAAPDQEPRSQVELAVVTATTPDGRITRIRWAHYHVLRGPSIAVRHIRGLTHVLLLPAATVDVDGAIAAASAHRWDNGHWFKPFDSLGHAIRLLGAHLRPPAAPGPRLITRARTHAEPATAVSAA